MTSSVTKMKRDIQHNGSVVMLLLSVTYAGCHKQTHYAECRYAEFLRATLRCAVKMQNAEIIFFSESHRSRWSGESESPSRNLFGAETGNCRKRNRKRKWSRSRNRKHQSEINFNDFCLKILCKICWNFFYRKFTFTFQNKLGCFIKLCVAKWCSLWKNSVN